MRPRAFRPEAPGPLEGRLLLSAAAADPATLTRRQFDNIALHIRAGFQQFGRTGDAADLLDDIRSVFVWIPFGSRDGLGETATRSVNDMKAGLVAGVPHAVRNAFDEVISAARADLQARAQSGDVVVP